MTAGTRLAALDRLRLSLPGTAFAGVQHLLGSSLANARTSLEDIGLAVGERRLLQHHLALASTSGDLLPLTDEECYDVLARHTVGRLAYIARAGIPDITPVNYVLEREALLIRSGAGPKLQAAERRELVAFEVDELDEERHTGVSVVVLGRAERLTPEEAAQCTSRPLPWAHGPRVHTIRVEPRRVTGRSLL